MFGIPQSNELIKLFKIFIHFQNLKLSSLINQLNLRLFSYLFQFKLKARETYIKPSKYINFLKII